MKVGFIKTVSGSTTEISIDRESFFLKDESDELVLSENGGSIKAEIDDDCLVLKIIQKLNSLQIDGNELQENSTYFLDIGETIVFGSCQLELVSISKDDNQPGPVKETPSFDEADSSEEDVLFELDDEESSSSQPTITNNNEEVGGITQILNNANSSTSNITNNKSKKSSKKKVTKKKIKKKSSEGLALGQARNYEGNKVKRDLNIKKGKKSRAKQSERTLVGPITRFLSAAALICGVTLLSAQVDSSAITSASSKTAAILTSQISKFADFSVSPEITKVLILLFIAILISNLFFSVSITMFICGATTQGSFVIKRLKAIVRTPLDFIATLLPIFEVTTIFDRPSLKEFITQARIEYRIRAFKFISPIMISIFMALAVGYPIIIENISNPTPPKKISIRKSIGKRPVKIGELLMSKKFASENLIFRIPSKRPEFLIVNKDNGQSLHIKGIALNKFEDYESILRSIPFFKQRYPYIFTYLEDKKTSFLVREDFSKLLWSGEIVRGQAKEDLPYLDFLSIGQAKQIFSRFKFPYTQYKNINKFTSFYRSSNQEMYQYIGKDGLYQFSVEGGSLKSSQLEGLTFLHRPKVKITQDSMIEVYLTKGNSDGLLKELAQASEAAAKSQSREDLSGFNNFIKNLAKFLQGEANTTRQSVVSEILKLSI